MHAPLFLGLAVVVVFCLRLVGEGNLFTDFSFA